MQPNDEKSYIDYTIKFNIQPLVLKALVNRHELFVDHPKLMNSRIARVNDAEGIVLVDRQDNTEQKFNADLCIKYGITNLGELMGLFYEKRTLQDL